MNNSLYVLYDEHCELCSRLKDWLAAQHSWISLTVLPAASARARAIFPDLHRIACGDLVVVSDAGEVYLDHHAWILCLYALEEYRDCAVRLSSPVLLPLARQAFDILSKDRAAMSRWMGASEGELAHELNATKPFSCGPGDGGNLCQPRIVENSVRDYLQ